MFDFGISKLVALLQFLLALAGCSMGGVDYTSRVAQDGHVSLSSRARVEDGVARFECRASDSGWCHYTLYPEACSQRRDCALAPLRRFVVARGDTRQFAGLRDFTPCVAADARPLGPDCKPDPAQGAAAAAPR